MIIRHFRYKMTINTYLTSSNEFLGFDIEQFLLQACKLSRLHRAQDVPKIFYSINNYENRRINIIKWVFSYPSQKGFLKQSRLNRCRAQTRYLTPAAQNVDGFEAFTSYNRNEQIFETWRVNLNKEASRKINKQHNSLQVLKSSIHKYKTAITIEEDYQLTESRLKIMHSIKKEQSPIQNYNHLLSKAYRNKRVDLSQVQSHKQKIKTIQQINQQSQHIDNIKFLKQKFKASVLSLKKRMKKLQMSHLNTCLCLTHFSIEITIQQTSAFSKLAKLFILKRVFSTKWARKYLASILYFWVRQKYKTKIQSNSAKRGKPQTDKLFSALTKERFLSRKRRLRIRLSFQRFVWDNGGNLLKQC